uniref:AMMECR1 domain-containing protein n=1 Tax=Phaeomonas parva TaxID=124430 RepID=A0A7S1XNQ3_9STRA|mmetsp:Transcript_23494/g.73687  ORF Transcript_23494/g.73687 Transcript_23494/m.73687 type:complete len:682 (+) Transcript_23494:54-2099(+)
MQHKLQKSLRKATLKSLYAEESLREIRGLPPPGDRPATSSRVLRRSLSSLSKSISFEDGKPRPVSPMVTPARGDRRAQTSHGGRGDWSPAPSGGMPDGSMSDWPLASMEEAGELATLDSEDATPLTFGEPSEMLKMGAPMLEWPGSSWRDMPQWPPDKDVYDTPDYVIYRGTMLANHRTQYHLPTLRPPSRNDPLLRRGAFPSQNHDRAIEMYREQGAFARTLQKEMRRLKLPGYQCGWRIDTRECFYDLPESLDTGALTESLCKFAFGVLMESLPPHPSKEPSTEGEDGVNDGGEDTPRSREPTPRPDITLGSEKHPNGRAAGPDLKAPPRPVPTLADCFSAKLPPDLRPYLEHQFAVRVSWHGARQIADPVIISDLKQLALHGKQPKLDAKKPELSRRPSSDKRGLFARRRSSDSRGSLASGLRRPMIRRRSTVTGAESLLGSSRRRRASGSGALRRGSSDVSASTSLKKKTRKNSTAGLEIQAKKADARRRSTARTSGEGLYITDFRGSGISMWPIYLLEADEMRLRRRPRTIGMDASANVKDLIRHSVLYDEAVPPIRRDELEQLYVEVHLLHSFESVENFFEWRMGWHGIAINFFDLLGNEYSAALMPDVAVKKQWNYQQALKFIVRKTGYAGPIIDELIHSAHYIRFQTTLRTLRYDDYVDQAKQCGDGGGDAHT